MAARRKRGRSGATPRKTTTERPRWVVFVMGVAVGVLTTLVTQTVDPLSRIERLSGAGTDHVHELLPATDRVAIDTQHLVVGREARTLGRRIGADGVQHRGYGRAQRREPQQVE